MRRASRLVVAVITIILVILLALGLPAFRERGALKTRWAPAGTGTKLNLVAAAVLEAPGDREQVLVGGGVGQDSDVVLGIPAGADRLAIVASLPKPVSDASTCAVACALAPGDSPRSLLVGRLSGVYYFPAKPAGGWEAPRRVWARPPGSGQVPSSVSVADTDGSGLLDIYIGMYQAMDRFRPFRFSAAETERSVFLAQTAPGVFADQTAARGLAGDRNTWTATFVDLDGSGSPDLVVAADEGPPVIYRNSGGRFVRDPIELPVGFWMGLAVGDFTGTGAPSIFLTNTGNSVPPPLMKMMGYDPAKTPGAAGLTTDHLLLVNEGGRLRPVPAAAGEGFGWGAVAVPWARPGLAFAQNWPMIPWQRVRALRNPGVVAEIYSRGQLCSAAEYPNRHFGLTALVADLRGDGRPYLVWVNIRGPVLAYQMRGCFPARRAVPRTAKTSGRWVAPGVVLTSGGTGLGSGETSRLAMTQAPCSGCGDTGLGCGESSRLAMAS
jgi:hypothetical protein